MKKRILIFPLDLRETMHQAIGEYVALSSRFEFLLIDAVSILLNVRDNKKKRISFMGMTFQARLGAFRALATYWSPNINLKRKVIRLVKRGHDVRKTRNTFAHGVWGHEKGKSKKQLYVYHTPESKDFYLPKSTHYTSAKIRRKARSVRTLNIRLEKVISEIAEAKNASVRKHAGQAR